MSNTLLSAADLRSKLETLGAYEWEAEARKAISDRQDALQAVLTGADDAKRDNLLASEQRAFDGHQDEIRRITALYDVEKVDRSGLITATGGPVQRTADTGNGDVLTRGESLADWTAKRGMGAPGAQEVRLSALLRSWVTGRRDGMNDAELRTMAEGTASAGGVIVPTPTASKLIDAARNRAQVFRAGAVTVPMTSETLKMPRLVGTSAPAWRAENAQIAAGDLSLDAVTFTARSLAFEVKCSRELLEDSDPDAAAMILNDLAAQVALEVDRVALRGTGTAPEPRGVLNQTGVTVTSHGTDGTTIADLGYDVLIDAEGTVSSLNHTPSGTILAPAVETGLRKARGVTDGQYLNPPPGMVPRYQSNQVPSNLTVGTSTDTSELYTADWSQLMVGLRTGPMTMQLVERYADMGQVAFIVWLRADVQLAHPEAFAVDVGVRP